MKYFSMFSGIGGFELGIKQAYVDSTTRGKKRRSQEDTQGDQGQGLLATQGGDTPATQGRPSEHPRDISDEGQPHCVGYSEIDKYATQIYAKHFPDHTNYGDITRLDPAVLPSFDLLVGGFPCQAFSIAGKRGGFEDTRGTLFFDIARILRAKQPRLFLLENVKGLLSHDNGKTFSTIISTLGELGYDLQWQVLNSKNFGVPQNRERVFIVGHLRGTSRPQVFPFLGTDGEDTETGRLHQADQGRVPSGQDGQEEIEHPGNAYHESAGEGSRHERGAPTLSVGTLRTHKDGNGFRELREGISPTIPARAREDGSGQPVIVQRARGNNEGGLHEVSPTLSSHSFQDNNHLLQDMKIRRLTPTECERLQGFPDGWTEGVSDTQRYKCLGNAVTVNVIQAIASKLLL